MTESPKPMFDLTGKVALVAGGAGYLGTPICEALAGQGASVMIADIADDRAQELAKKISGAGERVRATRLEAGDECSTREVVAQTIQTFGRLDILVNAAFHSIGKLLDELTAEEFDTANRVNLTGTFLLAREAAHAMQNGGSQIFFASMYGHLAPDPRLYAAPLKPNPLEYGVGKAGIIQMTKYLAVFWATQGIRVNAVAPGPFPNPAIIKNEPEFIRRLAQKTPLGRVGQNREITGTVVLLASDEGSFITGETINVDGGWSLW